MHKKFIIVMVLKGLFWALHKAITIHQEIEKILTGHKEHDRLLSPTISAP
jgi:hypothetical protein